MADCFRKRACRGRWRLYQWEDCDTFFLCEAERESMSVSESFALEGFYVFAAAAELAGFLAGCVRLWEQAAGRLRILWVENPEEDGFKWRCHGIFADHGYHPDGYGTAGEAAERPQHGKTAKTGSGQENDGMTGSRVTSGQWGFRFYEYYLDLYSGAELTAGEEGFLLKGEIGRFQTPWARFPLGRTLTISLTGGFMNFEVISGGTKENLFRLLDAGMIYGRLRKTEGEAEFYRGFVDLVENPLLFWHDAMTLAACLDPRDLMGAAGFYLPAGVVLATSFTDPFGRPMNGRTTKTTRLVFQPAPSYQYFGRSGEPEIKIRCYLGLAGEVDLLSGNQAAELLCGLIGMESVRAQGGILPLRFVPGGRAVLDEDGALTDCGLAPWAVFPENSLYLSQPEGNPLFAGGPGSGLDFKPLARCRVPAASAAVPLFPWWNATWAAAAEPYPELFEGVLRDERCKLLTGPTRADGGETGEGEDGQEEVLTASPQGLLVGLSGTGPLASWEFLCLGKGPDGTDLRLWGVDDSLRARFQNPAMAELFRDREELTSHAERLEGFQMEIEGWIFVLDPKTWRGREDEDTATCMVAKYQSDISLREMLHGEPVFERSLKACYKETGEPRTEYAAFLKWVDDPLFLGCLFLNCPVDTVRARERMIPEACLLLDGISPEDAAALYAHHVLIGKSRLTTEGGLKMEASPISAVVEYTGGEAVSYSRAPASRPEAEFATLSFLLAVEHSEVTVLNSVSELVLNRLFGTRCTGNGGSGSSLVVDGALRREEGESFFEYRLRAGASYTMTGMLEKTEISALKLSCGPALSTFYLGGRLFFAWDGKCDLFSYGEEPEPEAGGLPGLSYTGLEVILRRNGDAPEFCYNRIALDPLSSRPRAQSLAARFPAQVTGLLEETQADSPTGRGYVLLQAPIRQSPMTAPWYGLRFRIPLGSLGDLSQTGPLDLELLAAWSADGPDGAGCYLGVSLPAVLGGGGLDLQGLLKLGFSSVDVLTETDEKSQTHYSLRLNQFTVRALWVAFPPGSNCIHIVADPEGKRLGWYAAYLDEDV